MFYSCKKLENIEFNNKTLAKKLLNMDYMFGFCSSLRKINSKIFKANSLISLNYAFKDCYSLEILDLSDFNTNHFFFS